MNNNEKKEYRKPELIEWGSVNELTQGPSLGTAEGLKGLTSTT